MPDHGVSLSTARALLLLALLACQSCVQSTFNYCAPTPTPTMSAEPEPSRVALLCNYWIGDTEDARHAAGRSLNSWCERRGDE